MARFLHECKLNANSYYGYTQWIPFNEFRNIEYLAKDSFGEVYKAAWIKYDYDYNEKKYEEMEVVIKRIYNSSDKIADILNEVKQKFIINITINVNLLPLNKILYEVYT